MSDQGCDFVGHWQVLVGHSPMTDCYLQPCCFVEASLLVARVPGVKEVAGYQMYRLQSASCVFFPFKFYKSSKAPAALSCKQSILGNPGLQWGGGWEGKW